MKYNLQICSEIWLSLGEIRISPSTLQAVVAYSPISHVPLSLEVELTPHCHFLNITPPLPCKNFFSLRFITLLTPNHYSSVPPVIHPLSFIAAYGPHLFSESCHQPGCLQYDPLSTWLPGFLTWPLDSSSICSIISIFPPCIHAFVYAFIQKGSLITCCCCCSVAELCLTLCDPMDCRMPGFPVLHHLPERAHTHVHWVGDAFQPSCPLCFPSPPALNLS